MKYFMDFSTTETRPLQSTNTRSTGRTSHAPLRDFETVAGNATSILESARARGAVVQHGTQEGDMTAQHTLRRDHFSRVYSMLALQDESCGWAAGPRPLGRAGKHLLASKRQFQLPYKVQFRSRNALLGKCRYWRGERACVRASGGGSALRVPALSRSARQRACGLRRRPAK